MSGAGGPTGLDPRRAGEVIATGPGPVPDRGSGYLVTDRLVLTCAHVVADAISIRVRFDADRPGEWSAVAEPAWSHPGLDVALLRVVDSSITPGDAATPMVPRMRFGRIDRPPVPCEAIGYPLFKLRDDPARSDGDGRPARYRDSHHAVGTATTWSNRREGTLEVNVRAPERDPDPARSPWEGMSGAAVFSGECLVGVVGEHHRSDGLGTLAAYRIDHWHETLTADQVAELAALIGLPVRPDALTTVTAPGPGRRVPRQLPATTSSFTGRERELAELIDLADRARTGDTRGTVVISAIDGMAGIGKTELAVRAGHELAERFPDGQLFVDLHGYTEGLPPREPAAALAAFLQAFGVAPAQVPADLDARAALYRDHLAGTRTLILLDNAATESQIRPLLPGSSGCLVLITSRRRLKGLDDAHAVPLDVLPTPDAVALLREVSGPDSAPADDPAIEEIADLCGCLPLALRIAAALIRHRPAWTVRHLADKLREGRSGLTGFSDGDRSLAAVFDLSYRTLSDGQRLLLDRLGLVPGPDIDAYAAAALLDSDVTTAERRLQGLVDHNLLAESTPGRYRMHDLVRVYARARAEQDDPAADREAAVDRLFDYYQYAAQQADRHLARLAPAYVPTVTRVPPARPALGTREQAEAWMDAELANLIAAARSASARDRPDHAVALPAAMHSYLRNHGPWAQALELHAAAAAAADTLGNRAGQAAAADNLGSLLVATGDYADAARAHERALDLYRALDDRLGEAHALNNLGVVLRESSDYPGAAHAHEQALSLYRALGERQGEANALTQLASMRWRTGDYPAAAAAYQQILEAFRALDDRLGAAHALNNLGVVRRQIGDFPAAVDALDEALRLYRAVGDRQGQANALNNLGGAARETGDLDGAVPALEEALRLYDSLGDRQGQAEAVGNLGIVRRQLGDFAGAVRAVQQALELFREIGDKFGEAEAGNESAETFADIGDLEQSHTYRADALRLAREVAAPSIEAEALEGLGKLYLRQGRHDDGVQHLREALEIYRQLGAPGAERVEARLARVPADEGPLAAGDG